MTIDATKPPPKEKPWFKCSREGCDNLWRAYHMKVGCLCEECDDKTPEYVKNIQKEFDDER
jgi:hypothetical protein